MRVVIYTDDFEPITVIDLSDTAMNYLDKYGRVSLPVIEPLQYTPFNSVEQLQTCRVAQISSERFLRNGVEALMLFTRDEESTMLLKSAFLPGQQKDIQIREKMAFAKGFLSVLNRLGS